MFLFWCESELKSVQILRSTGQRSGSGLFSGDGKVTEGPVGARPRHKAPQFSDDGSMDVVLWAYAASSEPLHDVPRRGRGEHLVPLERVGPLVLGAVVSAHAAAGERARATAPLHEAAGVWRSDVLAAGRVV